MTFIRLDKIVKRPSTHKLNHFNMPIQGTPYFYFESTGEIIKTYWRNDVMDYRRHEIKNYFPTLEEVENLQIEFLPKPTNSISPALL